MNLMESLLLLIYLIASITFILGLKMLSNPKTARNGNLIAAAGMALAIIGTIAFYTDSSGDHLGNHLWIFGGLAIGGIVGTMSAKKSQNDRYAANGEFIQWNGWSLCRTHLNH